MGQQFEIQDYDGGELDEGVTPNTPPPPPQPESPQPQPAPQYVPPPQPVYEMPAPPPRRVGKLRVFAQLYWYYRWRTIPFTILFIVIIALAVPATRYPLAAMFLRRHYYVTLNDAKTGRPISGATVQLGDKQAETDKNGQAMLSVRVGARQLTVDKKYYQSAANDAFVGLTSSRQGQEVKLSATGRQVPLTVLDRVSNKPVADAVIKVLDTSATTDESGKTYLVLPATQTVRTAAVSAKNYNAASAQITVTDSVAAGNTLRLTPSGRVAFLSNASGSIDVVAANFDGSGRKTLVQATGNEDAHTQLFVSPDLKYAALWAKRDAGATPRLHVITLASGDVKVMDTALATFTPIGWANGHFIYTDERTDLQDWQAGQSELKSYSPSDANVTVLDKSDGEGTDGDTFMKETISAVTIVDNTILYGKAWSAGFKTDGLANHQNVINKVLPDGKGRQTLRSVQLAATAHYSYLFATVVKPRTVYVQSSVESTTVYYAYQNGTVNQSNTITANDVTKAYPAYSVNDNASQSFWTEVRDGKTVFFRGDADAGHARQIAMLDGYASNGWYGDNYLLVSKDSQLFIMPADGLAAGRTPLKISGYFTPTLDRL